LGQRIDYQSDQNNQKASKRRKPRKAIEWNSKRPRRKVHGEFIKGKKTFAKMKDVEKKYQGPREKSYRKNKERPNILSIIDRWSLSLSYRGRNGRVRATKKDKKTQGEKTKEQPTRRPHLIKTSCV